MNRHDDDRRLIDVDLVKIENERFDQSGIITMEMYVCVCFDVYFGSHLQIL